MKKLKKQLTYQNKKNLRGYGFISFWLAGTVLWFIIPALNSIEYSFRNVNPNNKNMLGEWTGLKNYIYAFTSDALYMNKLQESLKETAMLTPLIVIFSLFIAVLLSQKFKGRNFASAIFFIPVIIASGPVYNIISGDISKSGTDSGAEFSSMFRTDIIGDFFETMGIYNLNSSFVGIIETVSSEIIGLVWYSGIQILIFLASLSTIPQSAREIASIEGATAWEYFWKVTLPYISPAITANIVFTSINTFTYQDNGVISRILDMQAEWNYGIASAMAWSYFLAVLIFTGILVLIFNKFLKWD